MPTEQLAVQSFTCEQIWDLALLDRVSELALRNRVHLNDPERVAFRWRDPKTNKEDYQSWTPQLGFGLWTTQNILVRRLIQADLQEFAQDVVRKY